MNNLQLSIFAIFFLCPIAYLIGDEKINNGDSVMSPGTVTKPAMKTVNKKYDNTSLYTLTQEIEYKKEICPINFYTSNGNTTYNITQRFINKFYLNGNLAKTTVSEWMETNESCKGKEQQTINCPNGYAGIQNQEREVTVINGVYNNGEWYNTLNSCISIVTPPSPPIIPIPEKPKVTCIPIKPTNFGTLYRCERPDGTTYYTENP